MKNLLTLLCVIILATTASAQIVYDTIQTPYELEGDTFYVTTIDSSVVYTQWPIVDSLGIAHPIEVGVDSTTGLTLYRQFRELKATTTSIVVSYSEFYQVNGVKLSEVHKFYSDGEFRTYQWNSTIGFTIILPAINQRLQNL